MELLVGCYPERALVTRTALLHDPSGELACAAVQCAGLGVNLCVVTGRDILFRSGEPGKRSMWAYR